MRIKWPTFNANLHLAPFMLLLRGTVLLLHSVVQLGGESGIGRGLQVMDLEIILESTLHPSDPEDTDVP